MCNSSQRVRISFLIATILFSCTAFVPCTTAIADPPDILQNFRFIPRHSTLNVSGGFAGIDFNYNLFGRFDLVTGYDYSPLAIYPPILIPRAEFENVRAYALWDHPAAFAAPVPLSNFVDLESLEGTFRLGDPNNLLFEGIDVQNMPFTLKATQHGRLLHLHGMSDPSCCDFFRYEIDAYALTRPHADFNWDGRIDRIDAQTIMDHFGLAADATFDQGDADGDGDVDGSDFLTWQTQVGEVPEMAMIGAGFDAAAAETSGAPEPTSLFLFSCGIIFVAAARRSAAVYGIGQRPMPL